MTDAHEFGGAWTSRKLDVLAKYLAAYTTALKAQPFKKAYIDAFAGSGSRVARSFGRQGGLFSPELSLQDGSARIALRCRPAFDRYIFIEKDPRHCQQLDNLRSEFPELAERISIQQGEANQAIQALCDKTWSAHRAVLFLDPYGMQVDWTTVESIARTEAIDLWYLFPLGIGLNRLVTRSGRISDGWKRRVDRLLGTTAWVDAFYNTDREPDLLGEGRERLVKVPVTTIGSYVTERLKTIFPAVAEPGVLRNTAGNPLYLLCFAVGNPNPKAIGAALRIANSTLKGLR